MTVPNFATDLGAIPFRTTRDVIVSLFFTCVLYCILFCIPIICKRVFVGESQVVSIK